MLLCEASIELVGKCIFLKKVIGSEWWITKTNVKAITKRSTRCLLPLDYHRNVQNFQIFVDKFKGIIILSMFQSNK